MKTLVLISLVLASVASASELLVSDNIYTAVEKAKALSQRYGASKVLFVSDLDNTLLETKQDLASEPWFNWQQGLLKDEGNEKRIACDMQDLLHFYHVTISLSQVNPVQEAQHVAIAELQNAGVATMALTARGEVIASSTFQQLASAQIDFTKTSPKGQGFAAPYTPDVKDARPILYQRGVFFADGQHKGQMLKAFLKKINAKYKGVVFWDNDEKNTKRVYEELKDSLEVYSIRASRQDAKIRAFEESDKEKVTQEYLLLRRLLDKAYLYPRPCQLTIDKAL